MKYEKPEIVALVSALTAVQGGSKGQMGIFDGQLQNPYTTVPAYETDE